VTQVQRSGIRDSSRVKQNHNETHLRQIGAEMVPNSKATIWGGVTGCKTEPQSAPSSPLARTCAAPGPPHRWQGQSLGRESAYTVKCRCLKVPAPARGVWQICSVSHLQHHVMLSKPKHSTCYYIENADQSPPRDTQARRQHAGGCLWALRALPLPQQCMLPTCPALRLPQSPVLRASPVRHPWAW